MGARLLAVGVGVVAGGFLMVGLGVFNLAGALLPRHPLLHAGLWWRIATKSRPSGVDRAWLAMSGTAWIAGAIYLVAISR
jgi:hypothetical protein